MLEKILRNFSSLLPITTFMKSSKVSVLLSLVASCTTPNLNYRPHGGACTEHRQCESNACLPNGTCSDGTDVAFVDPRGDQNPEAPDGHECSLSEPCFYFVEALDTGRPYIKFTGTTKTGLTMTLTNRKLDLLADKGAKLTRSTPGPLIKVNGGSQIAIYDLELTGAKGREWAGILMPADSHSSVSLERVTIDDNEGSGIDLESTGILSVAHSTISNNQGFGIVANGGAIHVSQSTIENNAQGGLNLMKPTELNIANNFIVRNGNEASSVGALFVMKDPGGARGEIEFNTIVDNRVRPDKPTGGVMCYGNAEAPYNLILRNTKGTSSQAAQIDGDCGYSLSAFPSSDPGFQSATDYHLTSASPTGTFRDVFSCSDSVDFDGDSRPQGGKCDAGADEYKGP